MITTPFIADLQLLLDRQWGNDDLRSLTIIDHLTECKARYEAYKLSSINPMVCPPSALKKELYNKLVDLNILLDMWHLKAGSDLYAERLAVFKVKLPPEKIAKIAVILMEDDNDEDSPRILMLPVASIEEAYAKAMDDTYGLCTYIGINLYDYVTFGSSLPESWKLCDHRYVNGRKLKEGEEIRRRGGGRVDDKTDRN